MRCKRQDAFPSTAHKTTQTTLSLHTHLRHVQVIHKDDHALALRWTIHATLALVQLPVNDVLRRKQSQKTQCMDVKG